MRLDKRSLQILQMFADVFVKKCLIDLIYRYKSAVEKNSPVVEHTGK